MFEVEKRKEITKLSIKRIENIFLHFTKKREYAGLILVLFHYLLLTCTIWYIFFGDIDIYYYICSGFYLLLVCMHYYYNGCILTKAERSLLNDAKSWYGPPSIFLYGTDKMSCMNRCNTMIAYLAFVIVINSIIRLYNKEISLYFIMILIVLYFRNF